MNKYKIKIHNIQLIIIFKYHKLYTLITILNIKVFGTNYQYSINSINDNTYYILHNIMICVSVIDLPLIRCQFLFIDSSYHALDFSSPRLRCQ